MTRWVLDASAVIALLRREPGHEIVRDAVRQGTWLSAVNLSEVVAKLTEGGMPEAAVQATLRFVGAVIVPFDEEHAYATGLLRPPTRSLGLSLGDRACLALAQQLGVPALTADAAWLALAPDPEVRVIR